MCGDGLRIPTVVITPFHSENFVRACLISLRFEEERELEDKYLNRSVILSKYPEMVCKMATR